MHILYYSRQNVIFYALAYRIVINRPSKSNSFNYSIYVIVPNEASIKKVIENQYELYFMIMQVKMRPFVYLKECDHKVKPFKVLHIVFEMILLLSLLIMLFV